MDDRRRNYNYNFYNNSNNNQNYYQSGGGAKPFTRSQYRKPPQPPPPGPDYYKPDVPAWVHSVPSWERRFITTVGKMPWGRFVHCQKSLDLYNDIFQWDDSAGAEAFCNAKTRFWAEMHGHPCDIHSPDPDTYIDNIDWNAWSDPELYKDLDKVPVIAEEEKNIKSDSVDIAAPSYVAEPIVATGWGDDEPNLEGSNAKARNNDNAWTTQNEWEGVPWGANCLKSLMKPIIPPECVDHVDDPSYSFRYPSLQHGGDKINVNNNSWVDSCGGWENVHRSSQYDDKKINSNPWERNFGGWEGTRWGSQDGNRKCNDKNNPWERTSGGWEAVPWGANNPVNTTDSGNLGYQRNNGNWGTGNDNWRKRESEGHQLSRYKTTRHQGDDYQQDHGWRNSRGKKRVNFARENSPVENLAPRQWNSAHTCGPVSQHNPGEAGNSWGWQNKVSHHIN